MLEELMRRTLPPNPEQAKRDLVRRLFADGTVRAARGEVPQTELAERAGVDGSTWSRWETGHRSPRGAAADRAAEVVARLLEEADHQ